MINMRPLGPLLVVIACLVPAYWVWPLAMRYDFWPVMSQYIGIIALILMSFTQLLATRFVVLEHLFGGLDRIYVLHKWLGILALGAVLLHDTIDADIDRLGRENWLTELAETLGEFSLYSFLILGVITVATFIPYHWWKRTHKFMGALFTLSAFHYAFIIKPFALTDPLGIYTNIVCIAGMAFYLFTLLPNGMWRGRHAYSVQEVERTGDAVSIVLAPRRKGIRHAPGQFAFADFKLKNHREIHPFTISAPPKDNRHIRFSFKPLGDNTHRLAAGLKPGVDVKLSPAYGHFRRNKGSARPEIWIAGGIGITPFLAFAGALETSKTPVHLFYCVRQKDQAAHLSELEAVAQKHANFHFHLVESTVDGRISADLIGTKSGLNPSDCTVYFCGAKQMRTGLWNQLKARGLHPRAFKFEEFEIRQGIISAQTGGKIFDWLLKKAGQLMARRKKV